MSTTSNSPVMFDADSAKRIGTSVRFTEQFTPRLDGRPSTFHFFADEVYFGKPTGAYSSGTTMTLDPCDASGADNGATNATVYVQADQSSYTMPESTTVATTMIVPYVQGTSGSFYVLGYPVKVACITAGPDGAGCYTVKTKVIWCTFAGTTVA